MIDNLLWLIIPAAGVFLLTLFVKKKRDAYLKIISLLIDAIEIVDKEIKDVLSDAQMAKVLKVKKYIAKRLEKSQKKVIDKVLGNKGYIHGKGGK